jgi:catechol 2,3-dioxygenase-like lactoylglutathione lyase family enzyme
MKLEVVVLPVSDVDRAKEFYERIGWRLNADRSPSEDFRLVQFTPPGSWCSVHFGKGLTSATPGSAKAFLIVPDIEAARDQLIAAGVEVGEFFHDGPEGRGSGLHPQRLSYRSRAPYSVIPTATAGSYRRSRTGFPGASNLARRPSAPQAIWRTRSGVRKQPTASTRSALGSATRTGQSGTPPTW